MGVSITLANQVLQVDFLPGYQSQVNEKMSWFWKAMKRKESATSGGEFNWLARYGRSGGVGSRAEDSNLPDAKARARKVVKATPKNFYGRLKISDRLMKASKGAAFVNELETQMSELVTDSKNDFNRQLFGDGSAQLAKVSAATGPLATFKVDKSKFIDIGMSINIKTLANVDKYTDLEVIDVDKINLTVTVNQNVTVLSTDLVYLQDAYNAEITGLDALMQTGNTVYNIDRSSNAWFNPSVYSLAGTADLDAGYMENAFQTIDDQAGEKPTQIMAGYSAFRSLNDYLSAFQRYTELSTRYDAGHITMHYNGVPVEQDKYQGDQVMDFLTLDYFEIKHIGENFSFLNNDGSVLHRISNKAAYEATLVLYAELCAKYPKAQFRYEQIQKTTFTPA